MFRSQVVTHEEPLNEELRHLVERLPTLPPPVQFETNYHIPIFLN